MVEAASAYAKRRADHSDGKLPPVAAMPTPLTASRSTTNGMIERKNTMTFGQPSVSESAPRNVRARPVATYSADIGSLVESTPGWRMRDRLVGGEGFFSRTAARKRERRLRARPHGVCNVAISVKII